MVPPSVQRNIIIDRIFNGEVCIRFVDSAKNLGVILDNELSFEQQISRVVKACFATLKKLNQVKGFFSIEELKQLVSSLIFSNIDYCNALYFGISSSLLKRLQHIQNSAAKLVLKKKIPSGKLDATLTDLHWLKVQYRSIYKLVLIVHNCLHGKSPNEITALLSSTDSCRTNMLKQPTHRNKYGCRAFSFVGPKLWNMIPNDIRSIDNTEDFKKALKTFLIRNGDQFLYMLKTA